MTQSLARNGDSPGCNPRVTPVTLLPEEGIMKRALRVVAVLLVVLFVFAGGWLSGRLAIGSVVEPESMTEVERQFANRMRGVSLVGLFTIAGRESRGEPD